MGPGDDEEGVVTNGNGTLPDSVELGNWQLWGLFKLLLKGKGRISLL